ncbi:WXG100 family type VII secretion target [Nocardioides sp.]|jgi:WXG100 family type VII secretion target|uniref:WXG100 family type VII secretion target n=1 Tax=Nocardioides sp. TaxID=35761 RepID=UPI002628349C|nr:WXG100 family type VII secretion target [Nocardioides sp.]
MSAPYAIDLQVLQDTIDALAHCEASCDEALDDVVRRVARLHLTWSGLSADAQAEAQSRWEAGFATMRDGLAVMRGAAATSRDNYRAAIDANVSMWEAL